VSRSYPLSALPLARQYVSKQDLALICQVSLAGSRLDLDILEHKVCCVDLAMRVRIRNTYDFAFVLEYQNMRNLRPVAQVKVLIVRQCQQVLDLRLIEFRKRVIMARTVPRKASDSVGRLAPEHDGIAIDGRRSIRPDTGMVIVKEECRRV